MHMKKLLLLLASLLVSTISQGQVTAPPPSPAKDCEFHISADDSFELFVNGRPTWKGDDYAHVLKSTIPLHGGDVIVITVVDKQGGPGGHFAGVILRGNNLLATSKDFRYSVEPTPGFATSPNMQNWRSPSLDPLPLSFGLGPERQPKKAWTQKSDRKFGVVHFKFVVPN